VSISKRLRFSILMRDGFRCIYCGAEPNEARLHVDHKHPKARGGGDDAENLVTACADCNLGKSDLGITSRIPASAPPDDPHIGRWAIWHSSLNGQPTMGGRIINRLPNGDYCADLLDWFGGDACIDNVGDLRPNPRVKWFDSWEATCDHICALTNGNAT
jgi:hypothetical protein